MRKTDQACDACNSARFATAAPPPPSFLVVDILSAELNFHVQHGRQAYLLPPLAAWTTAACSRRI